MINKVTKAKVTLENYYSNLVGNRKRERERERERERSITTL